MQLQHVTAFQTNVDINQFHQVLQCWACCIKVISSINTEVTLYKKVFRFLRCMGFKLKKSSEIILHQIQPLQSCMRKCVIRRLFLRTTSEAICPCVIRAAAVGEGLFPYFINANKWVDSIVQCFQLYSFDWQMWNLSLFWMAILCNVPNNTFAF